MKMNRKFLIVLAALVILGAAAGCNKNKTGKESYDYSKILKGDLSEFAETWVNGYETIQFASNGKLIKYRDNADLKVEYLSYNKEHGYYTWSFGNNDGFGMTMILFPIGVDLKDFYDGDAKIFPTDTTKVRLLINTGRDPLTSKDVYYYQGTSGKAAPAETSGTATGKESYDYSKLLKGDFSDFSYTAGDWGAKDGSGKGWKLNADGTVINDTDADGDWVTQFEFYNVGDKGDYWGGKSGLNKKTGESGLGGAAAVLYPIGVDIYWNDQILQSDTTKVRLWTGQDSSPNTYVSELTYFRKKSGAAATSAQTVPYYATSNLRLRSEPDTSKDNRIAGVPQGSKVELLETGKTETIDNISAPWFKVKTADGTVGWLFSGYLSETAPTGSYDYAKILNKDFSDFAGNWKNGNGDRQELKNNGIFDVVHGIEITTPKRESNGAYSWTVLSGQDGWHMKLYPVGTAVPGVQSDTTKVRLTMVFTPDGTASQAEIYYKD